MKTTLILCLVLLVGVVSGAPANKKKFQHALSSPWSHAVMRAFHYQEPDADPQCCAEPPYLCRCCNRSPCSTGQGDAAGDAARWSPELEHGIVVRPLKKLNEGTGCRD